MVWVREDGTDFGAIFADEKEEDDENDGREV